MYEEEDYDWPSEGELVLCNVKNVRDFGAFVDLEEYEGKEGFIHISEISSGWVKRIRNHIHEEQKRVCKVLRVNKEKGHIDLSLKQVNEHQRRQKIQSWKNHKKAEKMLGIVSEEIGIDIDKCYDMFGYRLIEEFGSIYQAFEECTVNPDILEKHGFKGGWVETFKKIALENISPPYISISGIIELSSKGPNGVEDIKYALEDINNNENTMIEVSYLAAPKYRVEVKSLDYKSAEEYLEKKAKEAIQRIEERSGEGKFYREDN